MSYMFAFNDTGTRVIIIQQPHIKLEETAMYQSLEKGMQKYICRKMSIDSCHFNQVISAIHENSAIDILQLPEDLKKLIDRTSAVSAFVIEGLPSLYKYNKGSSAGTPLADVMFLLAITKPFEHDG